MSQQISILLTDTIQEKVDDYNLLYMAAGPVLAESECKPVQPMGVLCVSSAGSANQMVLMTAPLPLSHSSLSLAFQSSWTLTTHPGFSKK